MAIAPHARTRDDRQDEAPTATEATTSERWASVRLTEAAVVEHLGAVSARVASRPSPRSARARRLKARAGTLNPVVDFRPAPA